MKIWCGECKREMDIYELLGSGQAYLLKKVSTPICGLLIEALREYCFQNTKKGFVDGSMASIANTFKIECSRCKKVVDWIACNNFEFVSKNEKSVLL